MTTSDGIADEVVGELADVDQAVLVDADIDERAEGGDVGDDAGQFHARREVLGFVHAVGEAERLELLARIAAGFGEFGEDVVEGRQADVLGDVVLAVDLLAASSLSSRSWTLQPRSAAMRSTRRVAFGVDAGGVERVLRASRMRRNPAACSNAFSPRPATLSRSARDWNAPFSLR